jgi:dCTP diphosphatase
MSEQGPRASASLDELRAVIRTFAEDRDWAQFHSPKNLTMACAAEAGELLAEFQWLTEQGSWQAAEASPLRDRVTSEVADVAIYLLRLCDVLDVDLGRAVQEKITRNSSRFPAGDVRGRAVRGRDLSGGSA